jgi:hypothetical protein
MLDRQFTPSLLEWGGKRRKRREGLRPSETTRNVMGNNEIPEIKGLIGSGNGNGNRSPDWPAECSALEIAASA